jgi:hypothetical protein
MGIYWNHLSAMVCRPGYKIRHYPRLGCSECVSLELLLCMELLQSGRYDVIISKQGLINDSSN